MSTENQDLHHIGDWTADRRDGWTRLFNGDGEPVTTFYRLLSDDEVRIFKDGYYFGVNIGVKIGRDRKSIEIKQVLGL